MEIFQACSNTSKGNSNTGCIPCRLMHLTLKLSITNLRTEYRINPLGIETPVPRLSWEIVADGRKVRQKSFQIRCAESVSLLEQNSQIIWDSGIVDSEQSVQIEYGSRSLASGERIYWQVRVWDNRDLVSDWSSAAFWEMGLLQKSDWKAQWIEPELKEDTSDSAPCPYLRKEFTTNSAIRKATVYITSRGLYELSINGKKVGDQLFTPGWTSYPKRIQYQVFDVTDFLVQGSNAVGVILGDGWYRGYMGWQGKRNFYGDKLALLFQLKIIHDDGSEDLMISNDTWKSNTGPIMKSDIYHGESYDAQLELTGWNTSGYDDSNWQPVILWDHGFENLICSESVPVRVCQTIKPVKKIITPRGELVFDLGQNMTGWTQIKLKGKAGSKIVLDHAEVLDSEGNFYTQNLRSANAEDTYVFKGKETETWEPRFTFHGFRYVKVSEYSGEITTDNLRGRVIHSDMAPTGDFECSDTLINRLQDNIQWSLRGNFLDIPTDCPQRDERMGWTGDAQIFAPTACFNMDTSSFYSKWMKDFRVDQKEDGSIPWVVPNVIEDGAGTGWSDGYGATGWADAVVIIPWTVYQVYGDKRILSELYTTMRGWEEYMIRESGDSYIFRTGFHFGDWLSFAEYFTYRYNAPDYGYAGATTEKELIATAYFYYTTGLMHKIAVILGNKDDAERYGDLLPRIKKAFQDEFLTKNGRLTSNTQTAYVLALSFGLLPGDLVDIAAKRLADDINYFGHLTTGFLGTPLLCQALTNNGFSDIAYKLLFNKRYPSWLYPVTEGATTIWERWDGIRPDGSFQDQRMNSFNHYAYGAVGSWLYSSVAGIRFDEENPGYKRIIIKPYLTDKLDYAKAVFHSVYGRIVSHWKRCNDSIKFHVEIPPNTTACIYIPCSEKKQIYDSNKRVEELKEVKILGWQGGITILEIGSGKYVFEFDADF